MMSIAAIQEMSRERAAEACELGHVPFIVEKEDKEHWEDFGVTSFPFPNIGDYIPDGWEMERDLMVDSSGMGSDSEPALSIAQLVRELKPGKGYAIIEEGQFQLYLGEFTPPKYRKGK